MPHRTGYVFKGRAHACITRLRNGAVSGHIITIPGHFVITPGHCIISPGHCIISPGHCVDFLRCRRLTGRNTRWLVAMWIVYPQKATLV